IMENRVVLPAPFGPISAVMRWASAVNDARSTASRPPKRFDTRSTRSTASAIAAPQRCGCRSNRRPKATAQLGKDAADAARRERHHEDEDAAVDDEVESGRIAGRELGELSEDPDHERAKQRTENGADPSDDGGKQRLDRDPRPVGDTGIDEQEILSVETAARRGERSGDRHGAELDRGRVDTERLGSILVLAHGDEIGSEAPVLQPGGER